MLDVDAIHAHRWRQGSVFREDDHPRLSEAFQFDIPANSRLIVVSQDCDIVHPSIEGEPFVEVILATRLADGASGSLTYGKNPRRLHIPIRINDDAQDFECLSRRYIIDRRFLVGHAPDNDSVVASSTILVIRRWLAARYTRTAFPDEFNARIRKGLEVQERSLKRRGAEISGIYIAVNPWEEVDEGETYQVSLYATMEVETWSDHRIRGEMSSLLGDIATALNRCDGIEVDDFQLLSEADLSLADIRLLRRWDYDYLSYRDTPGGALPPQ